MQQQQQQLPQQQQKQMKDKRLWIIESAYFIESRRQKKEEEDRSSLCDNIARNLLFSNVVPTCYPTIDAIYICTIYDMRMYWYIFIYLPTSSFTWLLPTSLLILSLQRKKNKINLFIRQFATELEFKSDPANVKTTKQIVNATSWG